MKIYKYSHQSIYKYRDKRVYLESRVKSFNIPIFLYINPNGM